MVARDENPPSKVHAPEDDASGTMSHTIESKGCMVKGRSPQSSLSAIPLKVGNNRDGMGMHGGRGFRHLSNALGLSSSVSMEDQRSLSHSK